jgi:hypothetical protein
MKIIPRLAALAVATFTALAAAGVTAVDDGRSDLALSWLIGQKNRSGLYTSYEDGQVAYTYDQAVAALAFLVKNDMARARTLLATLASMQPADGGFFNSYYSASGEKEEGAKTVGPNMWVAIAVMNYEKRTGDTTYRKMATKAIEWALQFQEEDGGIDGGVDDTGERLTYASTEHNIDSVVALTYFGYAEQARRVKSFLDHVAWSHDHFLVGRPNGDTNDVLDVNAWGVLALGVSGTRPYGESLRYAMKRQRNVQSARGVSYDGFDFNADVHDIWFEGSIFMAMALSMAGDKANSTYFLQEVLKNQSANGGVQYSLHGSHNHYWDMETANSIASTGWLVLAMADYNPLALKK